MDNRLRIVRGDTIPFNLTITDTDDLPVNITGFTLFFTVKEDIADDDANAVVSISQTSHTDPANGLTSLVVPSATTELLSAGEYYWDLQIKYADGSIQSSYPGVLTVVADVTQRTS